MTDEILGYIYEHFKKTTPEEKNAFVLSLIPEARELSKSYHQPSVKYDYDKDLAQIVYMLRYYLPYSKNVLEVFKRLEVSNYKNYCFDNFKNSPDLDIAIFGAGPAPELYGFLDYIHNNNWSAKSITAHLFDEKKWIIARKIAKEKILPKIIHRRDQKFNRDLLIADWWMAFDSAGIPEGWEFIPKCKLAWFQNCFNEAKTEDIISFLSNLATHINSRSLIILTDLKRKGGNDSKKFKEICDGIDNSKWIATNNTKLLKIIEEVVYISYHDLNLNLSPDLKNKLFYVSGTRSLESEYLNLKKDNNFNLCVFLKL